jgi:hypothetical protein
MARFSVKLTKMGFSANAAMLPNDLLLIPQLWSASDRGGCRLATIAASGSAESLASLAGWLGDKVEILGEAGGPVWWGRIWDLEITLGNVVMSLSLDSVYNRVSVTYPFQLADGSVESRTTAWVADQNSIDHYGTRELLYGMPERFSNSAETVRDTLLERFKMAAPVINSQRGETLSATITGRGVWDKAAAVYFTNLDGLVEHQDENGSVIIGRHITSTQISFGTLTPGGEADEIHIATGDFLPLAPGDQFTITGATNAANNDTYTIQGMDATNQIGISGTFAAEAAGATVKISYGDGESQENIAQSFVPDTTWVCTHVAVKVRRIGSPSDNFRIGIYPDTAGAPGTVLTAYEAVGTTLFTELTWTEFTFATPVTLTGGTTYWLGMRRTGSANLTDGYEVAIDEDLGYADGVFRVYNGSAWVARSPDTDMPFRVIGEIDSTEQIEKAIAAVDAFDQSLIQVDSNIPVRQYTVDPRTALDELEDMLDASTDTGERLIAYVTSDDTVIVTTADVLTFGETYPVLGADGRLYYGSGAQMPPGTMVFGKRVQMQNLLLVDGTSIRAAGGNTVYVAACEYDAVSDTWAVEGEGALDPFQALTLKRG